MKFSAEYTATPSGTKLGLSNLGARLKAVRNAWGWSQATMAEVLRVNQASVSFWERGKISPSGSSMMSLAALFRCTFEALDSGEGFRIPEAPGHVRTSSLGETPRPVWVCLPPASESNVIMVDLASGSTLKQSASLASSALKQAKKDDRRIWVVLE